MPYRDGIHLWQRPPSGGPEREEIEEVGEQNPVPVYLPAAAGTTSGVAITRAGKVTDLVVPVNGTTTPEFDARGYAGFGLVIPSVFDGTALTFQVATTSGGNYQALYDIFNVAVGMTVAASRSYDLPAELYSWPYWKIVTTTTQTTTSTTFTVTAKG